MRWGRLAVGSAAVDVGFFLRDNFLDSVFERRSACRFANGRDATLDAMVVGPRISANHRR
jgi:hypothetical protein